MDKLNNLLVGLSVPMQAVEARAAARHVVEMTVHHAVEARLLRVPLQHQHAQLSVPVKAAEVQAAVRLAAEMIVHRAVETTVLPAVEITARLAAVTIAKHAAEARLQRILAQYQHAENSAPRVAVRSQAVARPVVVITVLPAVVRQAVRQISTSAICLRIFSF